MVLKKHLQATECVLKGVCEQLRLESRLQAMHVGMRASTKRIRIVSYYGRSGFPAQNTQELEAILDFLSEEPDVPTALVGDFNLRDDCEFWDAFIHQDFWTDAHLPPGMDRDPIPTCYSGLGPPSRIDFCLVNTHLRACLLSTGHVMDSGLPVHIPLLMEVDLNVRPLPLLCAPRVFPRLRTKVDLPSDLMQFQYHYEALLAETRMDQAYSAWSEFWERWLLIHTCGTSISPTHCGRGKEPDLKMVPPRSGACTNYSPLERHFQKLLGRILEYKRLQDKQGSYASALHQKITRQVRLLMLRHGPPMQPTTGDVLDDLVLHIRSLLKQEQVRLQKLRRAAWKLSFSQHRVTRKVAEYVRGASDKTLRTVDVSGQSVPVSSATQIFEALSQAWDQIHQLEEPSEYPELEPFLQSLPRISEMHLEPITPQQVRARLAQMKTSTARGPDSWSISELQDLPIEAHMQLAMLYAFAEHSGCWPQIFCVSYTVLLQKQSNPGPLQVRPIGLTAVAYRVWAAIRFQSLLSWTQQCLPESLTAYRPGINLQAMNLRRAVQLEECVENGDPDLVLSLDLTKAFDHIPMCWLLRVCERLSLPKAIVDLVAFRWRHQVSRWKAFGTLSAERRPKRGLTQGCALSCLLFNVAMSPLMRYVETLKIPSVLSAHADDLYLVAKTIPQAVQIYRIIKLFLQVLCIPLQTKKTQCLWPSPAGRSCVNLDGEEISPSAEIVVLGQSLQNHLPASGSAPNLLRQRCFLLRITRIAQLKAPYRLRLLLVQTMGMAVLNYCPWQVIPQNIASACVSEVARALWPTLPRHRCALILFLLFTPAHTVHPFFSLLYRLILEFGAFLRDRACATSFYGLHSRIGPKAVISEALSRLGIQLDASGRPSDDSGNSVPLTAPQSVQE